MKKFVSLIGAGAGSIDLLTLKAADRLKSADVIIFDRLADNRILELTRTDSEKIYVGKSPTRHTLSQDQINQLLVDKASEGKSVVRLKGGDPFVFGRGGEEAVYLREHGIEFELIPGISSAIAVPEYAGIPVTHRGIAKSFAVITGHEMDGDSQINWKNLATAVDTLIFLMGVANLEKIVENLVANARDSKTPAALIQWGTRANQKTITGTLETIANLAREQKMTSPAIFIVGEVVNLREKLEWFERRKLFGKKIIVTRSRKQASKLTRKLENLGAEIIEIPTIEIEPIEFKIDNIQNFDWIIFTSQNGVDQFFSKLEDVRMLGGIKIAAIGNATAESLKSHGIRPDLIPKNFVAESLIDEFSKINISRQKILIPRAEIARDILPAGLKNLGAEVEVIATYRTINPKIDQTDIDADLITFTSSSTVKNFVESFGIDPLKKIPSASIGIITSETLRNFGVEPIIEAQEFTIDGLVESIEEFYR